MSLLGGLVGGAFNTVGDLLGPFGNIFKSVAEERQFEERFEMQEDLMYNIMHLQNQFNIDAFNRENEYNTPLNQVRRLHQAGINPNWQGNVSNIAGDQNSVVQPAGVPDVANLHNSVLARRAQLKQEELQELQKEVLISEKEKNMSESGYYRQLGDKTFEETEGQKIQNQRQQTALDYDPTIYQTQIDELLSKQRNWESSASYNDAMTAYQQAITDPTVQELEAKVQELIAKKNLEEAQKVTEKELLPYLKRKFGSETALNFAEAFFYKCNAQAVLTSANAYSRSVDNQLDLGIIELGIKWAVADSTVKLNSALESLYKGEKHFTDQKTLSSLFHNIFIGTMVAHNIPDKYARELYTQLGLETENADANVKYNKAQAEQYFKDRLNAAADRVQGLGYDVVRGMVGFGNSVPYRQMKPTDQFKSTLPFNEFQLGF